MPVVPAGHSLTMISASPFPDVFTGTGKARIAHFGVRGNEQRADIEHLFDRVQRELTTPTAPVLLSADPRLLSDLFAPSDPVLERLGQLVVWTGRQSCFGELAESAAGVQRLLRHFYSIASARPSCVQVLYLADMSWPNAQTVVGLLKGIGIQVRKPNADGTVLAEINRPEGIVLTALLGESFPIEPDSRSLTCNREKDDASQRGDYTAVSNIERRELAELDEKLARGAPTLTADLCMPGKPVLRCGRLQTLVLEATGHSSASLIQLARALLTNPYPLLAPTDTRGQHFLPMQWEDGNKAFPVYTDTVSLEQTIRTTNLQDVRFGVAQLGIVQLCQTALQSQARLVVNAYTAKAEPRHLLLTPAMVNALATGRAPTLEELAQEKWSNR